jgi:hypothetical protein
MTEDSVPARRWADRHWPDPRITIRDQATARACAPDATGDPVEDRNAWFWRTADGSLVAVTKITGSVHVSTEPFDTLRDAADDFGTYWPAGFFWEEQGARDWMAYLAAKYPVNGESARYMAPANGGSSARTADQVRRTRPY